MKITTITTTNQVHVSHIINENLRILVSLRNLVLQRTLLLFSDGFKEVVSISSTGKKNADPLWNRQRKTNPFSKG